MNGRANIILDNLIADKKAIPMIVVMPQGHALQAPNVGPLVRIAGETGMFSPRFPRDLLEDILPYVEKNYRVIAVDLKGFGFSGKPDGDYSRRAQAIRISSSASDSKGHIPTALLILDAFNARQVFVDRCNAP